MPAPSGMSLGMHPFIVIVPSGRGQSNAANGDWRILNSVQERRTAKGDFLKWNAKDERQA
jgi:hypothetical protein